MFSKALIVLFFCTSAETARTAVYCRQDFTASSIFGCTVLLSLHHYMTYFSSSAPAFRSAIFKPVFVIFHFSLMNVCNIAALW